MNSKIKELFEKYRIPVGLVLICLLFTYVIELDNRTPAVKREAELGEKKEVEVGDVGLKHCYGDDFRLLVLAISEYDEKGNIIHKETGKYDADLYDRGWVMWNSDKYEPCLTDRGDIYYDHEYDEKDKVIHTTVRNSINGEREEYFFEYDESGKVVKCKNIDCNTGEEEDFSYEYDCSGNMTRVKSHYAEKKFNVSVFDKDTYFKHENEDGFFNTKIEENIVLSAPSANFNKTFSGSEELGIMRKLCETESDIPEDRVYPPFLNSKDSCPEYKYLLYLNYRDGEDVKTEYYRVYTEEGYNLYFGDTRVPVRIDGKVCFDGSNFSNRAKRTLIDYYLREDGTVEKSIEYTGFREEVASYKMESRYDRVTHRRYQKRTNIPESWNYD